VARAAVRALGAIGDEPARAALGALAGGEGERARWAAAELRR
jgi:HEAT repeat protein